MHRHIVYPGSIPLDTDFLSAVKDSYYGAGWLAESAIGVNTQVVGLAVTPTSPASLQVNVAPGAIYSLQTVDSAAYGALGTDANQFTKQGILAAGTTLTITPPGTVGQSINYLVQVAFSETDSNPVILPYYNASNPSVAWSGPNNTGVAQNTVRSDTCVVGLKAGAPAATGSQVTPAPDVGYTGIYVVTVAQGQTTITGGNITQVATAPYFPTLPQVPLTVQNGAWTYAAAAGSANALTATLSPIPTALVAGMCIAVKVATTNTGASTVNVNGLGAKAIVNARGGPLVGGELLAGRLVTLEYDGTAFQITSIVASNRQVLTANATFYVNASTGNDNNDGTTPGTAFLTLQKAWNTLQQNFDLGGFTATISATGAFTAGVNAGGSILGSPSPTAVSFVGTGGATITATNSSCFVASFGAAFLVSGFTLSATGAGGSQGSGIIASQGQVTVGSGMVFATCVQSHMVATSSGVINIVNNYSVTGGAQTHMQSGVGYIFLSGGLTATFTGTPNFSNATISMTSCAVFAGAGASMTGAATGTRFLVTFNAIINTNGGGVNFFPGSVAGSGSSGGVYA